MPSPSADGKGRDSSRTSSGVEHAEHAVDLQRAATTSSDAIRAWAAVERRIAACAVLGSGSRSSMNQPRPRRSASSSTRGAVARPTARPAAARSSASWSCPPSFRDDKRVPVWRNQASECSGGRAFGYRGHVPQGETQNGLSSVDRALRLLDELAEHGPLGATELANRLGTAKATAFRLARTLQARGYVVQNADSSYRLGPALPDAGDRRAREPRPAPRAPAGAGRAARGDRRDGAADDPRRRRRRLRRAARVARSRCCRSARWAPARRPTASRAGWPSWPRRRRTWWTACWRGPWSATPTPP